MDYDDEAIYVCGICYDDSPKDMQNEIGPRDNSPGNSEEFAVHINPFNDGINSNVSRKGYMANVTATEFKLADSDNIYRLFGIGTLSRIAENDSATNGYKLYLEAGKTGGSFQYLNTFWIISDTYNQDDLGYLWRNNEILNKFSLSYNIFKPFGIFLSFRNWLDIYYVRVYNPNDISEFSLKYAVTVEFKNRYTLGIQFALMPLEGHDYYETRTPNRFVVKNKYYQGNLSFSTDPRKIFSIDLFGSYSDSYDYEFDIKSWFLVVTPKLRINNRLRAFIEISLGKDHNELGFVERFTETDLILFGKRNRETLTNMFTVSYVFSNKASLNFRLRHYWSNAGYDSYYKLNEDGRLLPVEYDVCHDVNYNAFNIDLSFRWNFAPGSEMLVNWKNSIFTSDGRLIVPYWDNLKNTLEAPQINSFSIKIIYYFDYFDIKRLFKRK